MQARRRMRAAMVVALGAAAMLPALAATAGSASASALGPDPALSGTPNPSWWGTNGRVMDILPVGNRIYLAGGFDYVGPATGYGVGVDAAAGIKLPGAPVIDGVVRAAVADGQGGWFIGGDFKNVGGQYRRYAAQVTAVGCRHGLEPQAGPARRGTRLRRHDRLPRWRLHARSVTPRLLAWPRSPLPAPPTSSPASSPRRTAG